MKKILLVALALFSSVVMAGETWQRIQSPQTPHDIWHVDLNSIKRTQDTAIIRLRLSLFEDPTVNSVVYTEEFQCNHPLSKTLSVHFIMNGQETEMERSKVGFDDYYVPSVWEEARRIACELPHR